MRALSLVVLLGCGRIAFEPLDPGVAPDARTDAGAPGDAPVGGDGDTCATARVLAIGETLSDQSIAGAADDLDNNCGDGPEVVYAFTQPEMVTRAIRIDSTFAGAAWQASTCPAAAASCANFTPTTPVDTQTNFPAGTVYIVIDKTAGAGTTFTISVQ